MKIEQGNYFKGANMARGRGYGELRVLWVDLGNGEFAGQNCRTGMEHSGLKMKDFYFYEFL